ncbi:hypothetical protein R5W23_001571 [Gemmata sp. JC673]|uniref:Uncharacterized protein n=1 Tax=Gemmata algarum TaxID=2975278 RepID=A0ABU5F2J7_9BACT|nr:hypothetical protein [Gemmata algarum]MDY3560338.1 hypothetical protein [Gemmata algarum]
MPALFTVNTLLGAGGTNNERLPRETTGLRDLINPNATVNVATVGSATLPPLPH